MMAVWRLRILKIGRICQMLYEHSSSEAVLVRPLRMYVTRHAETLMAVEPHDMKVTAAVG